MLPWTLSQALVIPEQKDPHHRSQRKNWTKNHHSDSHCWGYPKPMQTGLTSKTVFFILLYFYLILLRRRQSKEHHHKYQFPLVFQKIYASCPSEIRARKMSLVRSRYKSKNVGLRSGFGSRYQYNFWYGSGFGYGSGFRSVCVLGWGLTPSASMRANANGFHARYAACVSLVYTPKFLLSLSAQSSSNIIISKRF